MNLQIYNFAYNNNIYKINSKYLCLNHNGLNFSPQISWNNSNLDIKSYVLILEDIKGSNVPNKSFIHWYVPYISNKINIFNEINNSNNIRSNDINFNHINSLIKNGKINFFIGENSLNYLKYFGPCAPINTGYHPYTFWLFGLDDIITLNKNNISIDSINDFKLKLGKINILSVETKTFYYSHKNNI